MKTHKSLTRGGLRANGIPEERDRPESQPARPEVGNLVEQELAAEQRSHDAIIRFFRMVLVKPETEAPEAK